MNRALDILAADPAPVVVVATPPHAGHTALGNIALSAIGTAVGGLLLYALLAIGRRIARKR
ncbi:MAG: hypothetical protein Q8S13_07410 [Dehalococcoidia bacterium]|nr:hypothetical protein [Dehalococcoidia bacterium]